MRARRFVLTGLMVLGAACHLSRAGDPPAATAEQSVEAPAKEGVTLLGMLSEWIYPESKFHGAESSDAAVTGISSIKSKSRLTTTDSVEQVVEHYRKLLKVDAEGTNLGGKAGERVTTKRAISIQDNSEGRPLKLVVITITEPGDATTLVISRAAGEELTNITWSNFRQL